MSNFETGKTYQTRLICDSDCIVRLNVISRTAKTIKASVNGEETKTFRIFLTYDNFEAVRPYGSYSMAPIISADKLAA